MNYTRNLWPDPSFLTNLYDSQRAILPDIFRSRFGILAGTPGTGKSFVTASIIKHLVNIHGAHTIAVVAPTGKAAVRITRLMESHGLRLTATTIHRLLEVGRNGHDGDGWGFQRHKFRPCQQMFYFIDETSMLDTNLAAALLEAIPDGAHVLFIGDPYQLPPVGPGAPLRDMMASKSELIGFGELTEVQRNAGDIVHGCRKIKAGEYFRPNTSRLDLASGKNWLHSEMRSPSSQVSKMQCLLRSLPKSFDPIDDVQVICALNGKSVNEKHQLSRIQLNLYLQMLLNPENTIEKNRRFALNDKVICTGNGLLELAKISVDSAGMKTIVEEGTHEIVANGEIGRVRAMDSKRAAITLDSGRTVICPLTNSDGSKARFELGYAVTCHKMQGSQSPIIVVMLDDSAGANWIASREWHYTAISRSETICVTIGKWETLMRQSKIQSLGKRKTFLTERITELHRNSTPSVSTALTTPVESV